MFRIKDARPPATGVLVILAAAGLLAGACVRAAPPDPVRDEVERWSASIAADTTSDPLSREIRAVAGPVLARARAALEKRRRHLALFELSRALPLLHALAYVAERQADIASIEALEAEWKRLGGVLPPAPTAAGGAPPARIRSALSGALAEAAWPQVRIYYDASLEYGRSTQPGAGLFYLGQAQAQEAFVTFAATLAESAPDRSPPFRGIEAELAALESEILSAYHPPASIDLHPGFIAAAAALKEARELDALGFRRGALLRYLQGSLRAQPLMASPPRFDVAATPARLDAFAARVDRSGADHGLARLFLELAQADIEDTTRHDVAAAIAEVVLPRYFAALEPAAPRPAAPTPTITVTLVRWPYT